MANITAEEVTGSPKRARRRANQLAAKATARARTILDLKSVAMKMMIIPLLRRKVTEVKMIPLQRKKVTEVKMIPLQRRIVKTKVPIEARTLML